MWLMRFQCVGVWVSIGPASTKDTHIVDGAYTQFRLAQNSPCVGSSGA
jgi:hypothetical protein